VKKLKLGVIGAGGIARRRVLPALVNARNCEVVAVMNPSNATGLAQEFGIARAYSDHNALLKDRDVEAVYIASPVAFHHQQIIDAANKGKHVLCEKPLTLNVPEAEAAVAACRQNRVVLQEGYMMKFHGAHAAMKKMIDAGDIGRVVSMRAQLACWYPPMPGAWRQDPRIGGGGALMDMATHLIDLMEFFAGPVERLTALTGRLVQNYESEDSSTILMRHKNGAQSVVEAFFCVPDVASRTRLEVYGSKGSIHTTGTIGQGADGVVEAVCGIPAGGYDAAQDKTGSGGFQRIDYPQVNTYTAQFEYFGDNVRLGRDPELNGGEHGLHILRLAKLAYVSAREGLQIEV
jgi:predicted dehydrogenase